MFVSKVPSLHCFKAHLWCQTHFGIKATLTTTIVKTNQDALSQDILTRDSNLTCLKDKYLKIEPFGHHRFATAISSGRAAQQGYGRR